MRIGDQIGNYVIEQEIAGGGMALVYRVRHAVLGTIHALKVLDDAHREKGEVRARFLREGMIAAKLDHPNVVRVTDTVSTAEVAGLVMEFVNGPNLEQHIRGLKGPPGPDEIRQYFVPVLRAVAEAHRRGIIHRDIKPANILLEPRAGGGYRPKVTDFGIAKLTGSDLVQKKGSTHAEARMGTLSYMSPEQVRGAKEVTARSDIFSLGATLYELATCSVAFDGPSDYDIMHHIVQGQQTNPERLDKVDPLIAAAIRRALAVDPKDRFATCDEFVEALGRFQSQTGPSSAPSEAGNLGTAAKPSQPPQSPQPAVPSAPSLRKAPSGPGDAVRSIASAPRATLPGAPAAGQGATGAVAAARPSGRPATGSPQPLIPCPFCAEPIFAGAKKCKHCHEYLERGLREAQMLSQQPLVLQQETAPALPVQQDRPALAVLSFFWPGLGQICGGYVGSGVLWMAFTLVGYACFVVPGLILHVLCIRNAYLARR